MYIREIISGTCVYIADICMCNIFVNRLKKRAVRDLHTYETILLKLDPVYSNISGTRYSSSRSEPEVGSGVCISMQMSFAGVSLCLSEKHPTDLSK